MTLFSIPAMVMYRSGTKVPVSDRDFLGLYKFTLGNIGYNPDDVNYATESACKTAGYGVNSNSTCIYVLGTVSKLGELFFCGGGTRLGIILLYCFGWSW